MKGSVGRLTAIVSFAVAASAPGVALAQNEVVSEARLLRAKQHMQQVCQPLETRREFSKAARCFSNVTAYLTDPTVALATPMQPRLAREPVAPSSSRVAMLVPRRGSSLLTSNFVLLGVGY
ncbi:hypothetical protein [Methylorubrum aminovorans]